MPSGEVAVVHHIGDEEGTHHLEQRFDVLLVVPWACDAMEQEAVDESDKGSCRLLGRTARILHVDYTRDRLGRTLGAARVDCMVAMTAMDLRAGLASINVPVTVLVGTRDLLTPPFRARMIVDYIPHAELQILPDAGHMLPLEAPDRIVEAVVRQFAGGKEA